METFSNDHREEDPLAEMSASDWEVVRQDTFWDDDVEIDIYLESLDEADGIDDHQCYLGHRNCYDEHTTERRADEADWEEDRRRELGS